MNTGDIILIQSNFKGPYAWWSYAISKWTRSPWTHVAVIFQAKNDEFYVLESAEESGVWGVQVHPYNEYLKMYNGNFLVIRHLYQNKLTRRDILQRIEVILNTLGSTNYDTSLFDLLATAFQTDKIGNPRNLNKMYCSALVAYFYTQMGWFNPSTEWTLIQPKHFSKENQIHLQPGVRLGDYYAIV
tara:strand:+ start:6061 stop:6618 length:558 start_codon:yes stop_codon:yes gene_type:complete